MKPFRFAALVLAAALLIGACADAKKSDAKQAEDQLEKGLKAQTAGKTDEATKAYDEALVLDPRNKFAAYNLGLINQLAGTIEAAERYYRMTLTIDPDFVPALFNLAIIRTGPAPEEAETLYRHAVGVAPNDPGPHLNLGYLLISQGRPDEGNAQIAIATQLDARNTQGSDQTTKTTMATTSTTNR